MVAHVSPHTGELEAETEEDPQLHRTLSQNKYE